MIDNTPATAGTPAEPAPPAALVAYRVTLSDPPPAELAEPADRAARAELAALLAAPLAPRSHRRLSPVAAAVLSGLAGWLALALIVVAALALSGCSRPARRPAAGTRRPPATLATLAPSPTPADARAACNEVVRLGNAFNFDPTENAAAGQVAAEVAEPGIATAGRRLADAATAAMSATDTVSANLDISEAQLAVAQSCADTYGDGPW